LWARCIHDGVSFRIRVLLCVAYGRSTVLDCVIITHLTVTVAVETLIVIVIVTAMTTMTVTVTVTVTMTSQP
jgi:hypothetical protein